MRRTLLKLRFLSLVIVAMFAALWPMAAQAAATAPSLGAAAGFSVLANGTGLTCTDSVVTGRVGVSSSSTAITSTRCTMQTQVAATAYSNLQTAYNGIAGHLGPCTQTFGIANTLAGAHLGTGVYCFPAAATLTGTLTLTGSGPWIFEIGTGGTGALSTTSFTVVGTNPCNAFWWVRQDATVKTSAFQGTILAGDMTFTDTTLTGRALANGAVTMTRTHVFGCNAAGGVVGCGQDGDDEDGGDGEAGHKTSNRHHDDESSSSSVCKDEDSSEGDSNKEHEGDKSEGDKSEAIKHEGDKSEAIKHVAIKHVAIKHEGDKSVAIKHVAIKNRPISVKVNTSEQGQHEGD